MSNDLSEDLIVEVFSRLPTKSLLRFRSLSKSLCACIGSPGFIRLHTLRSPKKITIIHRTREKLVYTSLPEAQLSYNPYIGITPINYPFKSFRIVGSSNGILCIYESGKGINLWNPSTRRKVLIPELPSSGDRLVHGFGFDPIVDDYNILRISKAGSFIYTLKTHTWREITPPITRYSYVKPHSCAFDGALHWVVDSFDECYHSYILTFDLNSEVFSTIRLPEPRWETYEVTIVKGCLAVISSKHGTSRIWVMRKLNNIVASWFRVIILNTNKDPFKGFKRVFERATNGDLVFNNSKGIEGYDLKNQVLIRRLKILTCSSWIVDMNMCDESLGLLDMGTSCDQGSKSSGQKEKQNK